MCIREDKKKRIITTDVRQEQKGIMFAKVLHEEMETRTNGHKRSHVCVTENNAKTEKALIPRQCE